MATGKEIDIHLVTTALREFWPESGPIWLLSPGCLIDHEDHEVKGRWEIKGIVSDPFRNEQERSAAYADIWRITSDLIHLLSSRLNDIHGTNHSERYWRTHIGIWAILFVTVIYDRHARLLKAKTEIGNFTAIGSSDADAAITLDTVSFALQAADDFYNCQIYTYLCKKLGIPFVEYSFKNKFSRPQESKSPNPARIKNALRKIMRSGYAALASAFAQRADVLMVSSYLPRWFEIELSFATSGMVFPLHMQTPMNMSSDTFTNVTARSALSAVPEGHDGITALVVEMAKLCLPKSFVEDYQEVCSYSDSTYRKYQPKAIYSANSWWFDESFKHWAAKCQEQGTRLIGGAHGSEYFVRKYENFESFEVLLSDKYLTWGWSEPNQPKLIPTPACKLIYIDRRPNRISGESILFGGTAGPRHSVWILGNFSDYLEWQQRFFAGFPQTFMSKFLVRLHYEDYGWKMKDRLARIAPTLRFDSWDVGFRKRLNSCRLYVCDHLSTTYSEALAANIPTVLFLDEEMHPIRPTAVSYVQALRDCHILHGTPESAAAWVLRVYDDPAPWWLSAPCQNAVKEFCHYYARTSETPLRDWKQTFRELVS